MRYDLIILGNDPVGVDGALEAVRLNKRVVVVTKPVANGSPSLSSIRQVALMLTGFRHRKSSSDRAARRREVTMEQLLQRSREIESQKFAEREKLLRDQGVDFWQGTPRLVGTHEVEVTSAMGETRILRGDKMLLAVGSQSSRPSHIPFDGVAILDSDEVRSLVRIPKSMIVIGGGPLALEYATTLALLGTRVAVISDQGRLFEFCDRELARLFRRHATKLGVRFRLGRAVNVIERTFDGRAAVRLEGGKSLLAECVLYAGSQHGRTESLDLNAAGLLADEQGRLWCNEYGQTWVKNLYGVGEVVGFPASTSLAIGQGSRAIRHAFRQPASDMLPVAHGVKTTPEIAMVGATEQQLRHDLVAYEVGVARFREDARGHVGGAESGMLKLLFHRESLELLGVHCLGESAAERIRLGQTVMSMGGSIELFRDECLSDSTLSDCYRLAAEDGMRRVEEATAISESRLRIWRPSSRRRHRLVPSHR